jgi:signal transduction histidine kinase
MEVAFELSENPKQLFKQYEKSCYIDECDDLCGYDALKIRYYRLAGEYSKAISYANKALKKRGDSKFKDQILVEKAIVYYLKSNFQETVDLIHRALSNGAIDKETQAKAYLMLGNAHRDLGNVHYASRYFSKTYYAGLSIQDSSLVSAALNGQGLIAYGKSAKNDTKRSIAFFQKSLNYLQDKESVQALLRLNNIAAAYANLNDFVKAEMYFKQCLDLYTKQQDFEGVVSTCNNLADIYIQTNEWSNAKVYLDQAIAMYSNELEGFDMLNELNLTLSDYYYHESKYALSRDYYAKYAEQELKRLNTEQSEAVIESQERYDDLKRTKLINDLKLFKKRAEVNNLRLQNAIYIILVCFISLGIGVYIIISRRRKTEKRERKLALNRAALYSAENEKLRVSRELHDSMGGTLTVMNLLLGNEKDSDPTNKNIALLSETTKNAIDDLRRICRDLYPSELKISGLSQSLQSYFYKLNNSQTEVKFELVAPDELILDLGFSINFYRIAQELTNNTLKYAKASEATLKIDVKDGKFFAFYNDNGQGVDLKQLLKGVGLNSIEERCFSYKGKLEFKSGINQGFGAIMVFSSENISFTEKED